MNPLSFLVNPLDTLQSEFPPPPWCEPPKEFYIYSWGCYMLHWEYAEFCDELIESGLYH